MSRSAVRLRHLVDCVVEKSNGDTAPYLGLEGIASSTGRLVTTELPEKAAADSIVFRPSDVLFGKLRPYLAKSWLATQWGTGSGELMVLRARPGVSSRFLLYSTLGRAWLDWAELNSYGSKMPRTSWEEMADLRLPELDFDEQEAIAEFLDRETAQIDAMIDAQQRLVHLLNERRRAISDNTVLHGLGVGDARRPSGADWFDEVPAHWGVTRLSWHSRCRSGDGLSVGDVEKEADDSHGVPVIGGNGVMGYTARANVQGDVIVVGRVGALCGNVHLVSGPAWITDNALRLDIVEGFNLRYLTRVLDARRLNDIAAKTAQPLITGSQVSGQRLPLPPLAEQAAIADFVDAATLQMEAMIGRSLDMMSLLRERRAAVITAAVTGRLDPRTGVERVEEIMERATL